MKIRAAATAALTVSAALLLSGCGTGTDDVSMPGMDHGSASPSTGVNDADVMFASMMVVHHEQAIEMSDLVLDAEGVDPAVTDLAVRIKAAQGPEIDQLQGWLGEWGIRSDDRDMSGMDHGDGMMSEDDLAQLRAADGLEASRLFLEQMIVHHEGAVEMAQVQVEDGDDPEAIALAEAIIEAQTDEIQEMNDLLAAL
ncbi:DUF305 domain-containing protein [Microbacterium sp. KSW4-16]|uniref:DUF305 domain-containing protein n=1 Tax=Microbacterium TaxID=33882 RepID=UPI00103A0CF6|nr:MULTISPECIES: DUF305 domain-containing protein [Microbacterium]MCK8465751.1 DUF305 domain-containing protein [Microbacterium aurugineum]QEA29908.1 DUF305 domain-containing protein [Microbacterium sp. CBA3102]TCJ29162.1 DUF305 domain-containing protein [Microbacterium sp. PI-1]